MPAAQPRPASQFWLQQSQIAIDAGNELSLAMSLCLFARFAHHFNGTGAIAGACMNGSQRVQIGGRTLGLGIERSFQLRNRRRVSSLVGVNPAEMKMSERVRRVRIYRAPVQRRRLIPLSQLLENRAQVVQGLRMMGLKAYRAVERGSGLGHSLTLKTEDTEVVVRVSFVW